MGELGKILLDAVFLLCCLATVFALLGIKVVFLTGWARRMVVFAAGLSVASLILFVVAFLSDDFSIAAVAQYSSTKLPFFYKLSAVWAGASGSLLLWLVIVLLLFAVWFVVRGSEFKVRSSEFGVNFAALSIGSGVCFVFSAFLVFVARPFASAPEMANEGMGLNPLLQNFWMVIHPPLLFVGYSAFLLPFVIALSCVFAGRTGDITVYRQLRWWLLFGICFLGLGIATGARWSYVELGWGGYWAWDPVENASLLPWLVAVAALHCIVGVPLADRFRLWAVILAPLPFILCLLATFVTRSGILSSVHSFDRSAASSALLVFIGCCFLLWLVCVIRAMRDISVTPPSPCPFRLNRGKILSWAVVTLVFTAVIIGVATFWPVIWRLIRLSAPAFTPTAAFYNITVSVVGILWAFLIGLAALSDLPRTRSIFALKLLFCSAAGLLCFCTVLKLGGKQLLISIACGICAFSFAGIFFKLLHKLMRRGRVAAEIAHLGLLLLVVAAGFSSGEENVQTLLNKGGKITLSGYEFTYDSFEHKLSNGITRVGPEIVVRENGRKIKLWPHSNLYPTSGSSSEVAVHTGLLEDIYVSFDGIDQNGGVVITAKIKPFMFWLWLAAALIITGVALAASEGARKRPSVLFSDT